MVFSSVQSLFAICSVLQPSTTSARILISFGVRRARRPSSHSRIVSAEIKPTVGYFANVANPRWVDLIAARLRLQAYSLSIIDGFLLIAWSCACALILVALLRKSPLKYGDLSAIQQTLVIQVG